MANPKSSADRHLVIIDDDITALDIVSFLFESNGFEVHRFTDGQSAINYMQDVKPDLMIVDLMMPGINGIETVKQVRDLGLKSLPVIAFTAVDETTLHEEAQEAGCDIVLTKPCSSEKLLKNVNTLLKEPLAK